MSEANVDYDGSAANGYGSEESTLADHHAISADTAAPRRSPAAAPPQPPPLPPRQSLPPPPPPLPSSSRPSLDWSPTQDNRLSLPATPSGLRPLRLSVVLSQPSVSERAHLLYDAQLRAERVTSRLDRRRHWQERAPNECETLRKMLDNSEGLFEVQQCFLARLAREENAVLEQPGKEQHHPSFHHSSAGEPSQSLYEMQPIGPQAADSNDDAREQMESLRQEIEEALGPLLAYGRLPPPRKPPATVWRPVNVDKQLPPTPPQSPAKNRGFRDVSDYHYGNHNGNHRQHQRHSHLSTDGADEEDDSKSDVWRQSVKRASSIFGWGGAS